MKKGLLFFSSLLVLSCATLKNSDPYVGSYDITIYEVDNIGDIQLTLNIVKTESGYTSTLIPQVTADDQDVDFDVDQTSLEDNIFTIEAFAGGYGLSFDLTIEGDEVSGSLLGMFDISGVCTKK